MTPSCRIQSPRVGTTNAALARLAAGRRDPARGDATGAKMMNAVWPAAVQGGSFVSLHYKSQNDNVDHPPSGSKSCSEKNIFRIRKLKEFRGWFIHSLNVYVLSFVLTFKTLN